MIPARSTSTAEDETSNTPLQIDFCVQGIGAVLRHRIGHVIACCASDIADLPLGAC